MTSPTLERERILLAQHSAIIACDEVGRGALAGPVTVGAVLFDASCAPDIPAGLKDSKLVPEKRRPLLAAQAGEWVRASALGWVVPAEVDRHGIIWALGQAALRAIAGLQGCPADAVVLLDGSHDYIAVAGGCGYPVRTVVKGDRDCASISAASVLAKVARDEEMIRLAAEHPGYGWERNKGYGSADHRRAIAELGISPHHRATWIREPEALF